MKKSFPLFISAVILLSFILLNPAVYGKETRTFNYKNFNAIEIGSGMYLNVTQSDSYGIEATGSEKDLKDLKVEKKGNVLSISFKNHSFFGFNRHSRVEFNIQMPELTSLDLSGGARGDIKMEISSKDFSSDLSGGSYLKGNLKCGSISFDLSGGSRVSMNGTGANLKIDGSGGSKFHLEDFSATDAYIELSGGSQATVKMNGKLDADLSGGSHIYYYGKIELGSTDFSGGSGISKGR